VINTKSFISGVVVFALTLFGALFSEVDAQVFEVSSPNQLVPVGSGSADFDLEFSLQQTSGALIDTCGFSFQFSHDPTVLQLGPTGATTAGALAALDGGAGPDFFDGETFPTGFTVGSVFSFSFDQTLQFDVPKVLISAGYSVQPSAIANLSDDLLTVVSMSDNLGAPPVDNLVSNCGGTTETLIGTDCVVTLQPEPPLDFQISSGNQTLLASEVIANGLQVEFSLIQIPDVPADITPTNGFSFAYGHDASLFSADSVIQGSDLAGLDNGAGPAFFQESLFTSGAAVGCLYDFQVQETITFDNSLHVATFSYSAIAGSLDNLSEALVTNLEISTVLGTPAIDSVVVIDGGTAIAANVLPVEISIEPTPAFSLSAPLQEGSFSPASGSGSFSVLMELVEESSNPGFPSDTQGFSVGLGHDSSLLEATGGGPGPALSALNSGSGPDFFDTNIFTDGVTFGCVFSFTNPAINTLSFDTAQAIVEASYQTVPSAFVGQTEPVSTSLQANSNLGSPPVEQVIVVNSQSQNLFVAGCQIVLSPGGGFDRGDCNDDGSFDIADGVSLLSFLFLSGSVSCLNACDNNDDEGVDIADAVSALAALFTGGPAPPGNGTCGPDSTPGSLSCDSFNSCL